jgi:hypothetical protein
LPNDVLVYGTNSKELTEGAMHVACMGERIIAYNCPVENLGGGGEHKFGALGVGGRVILKSEGRGFEGADWTDMLPVGSNSGPF